MTMIPALIEKCYIDLCRYLIYYFLVMSIDTGSRSGSDEFRPYPFTVRFALEHNAAQLSLSHIRSLSKSGHGELAFYLAMKAHSDNPEAQIEMFQAAADHQFEVSGMPYEAIGSIVKKATKSSIIGGKLARIQRLGITGLRDCFDNQLTKNNASERNLIAIANSAYLGTAELAKHSLHQNRPLTFIDPKHISAERDVIGFRVTPSETGHYTYDLVNLDIEQTNGALFIDDTIRTGKTRSIIADTWGDHSFSFVGAIRLGQAIES